MVKSERKELLWRIFVLIVSGIVLHVWGGLVLILSTVNWVIVLFTNKRNRDIADFCEYWNSEMYIFMKYISMVSNERPFPFEKLKKLGKFER